MQYRPLGRTGLNVSVIGLGTMTWGFQNTQAEGFEQMDYALERGINFFDTAEMYSIPPTAERFGNTEEIIGNWFAKRGKREQVILASKMTGPSLEWVRGGSAITPDTVVQAVEGSLKRLQTDYIDLYQLHWPNRGSYHFGKVWQFAPNFDAQAEKANFLAVLQCFEQLINDGKIRHIGLSNETAWGLQQWLSIGEREALPRIASIQNEYSLLCRHFEPDLAEIAVAEDCGLLAWSPLCRGMLSGKYLNGAKPKGARLTLDTRHDFRSNANTDAAIQAYINLAQAHGLDVTQMALAFVNSRPFVTSNLIGATSMQQLRSNIDSIDLELTEDVLTGIETIRRQYPMVF
ncbi:aldo/keto reductase [Salinibius halmophilus]|uniref:aldo/keto reductase n=1 Tax=Salinibius halmophilus TaxID=1853216 RepID=UPI000E6716C7|nr:aldo/keto reductase [Salinibius halmophilus]